MNNFSVKTIKGQKDNEVSFCPSRGGIITSLKLKGKEVLYFDSDTFLDQNKSVRGGIPILFPNAGELKNNDIFPNLKRHGFAKNAEWQKEMTDISFIETLKANKETMSVYPYDFNLSIVGIFEKDGSFTLKQEVKNNENEKELPVSMGLHPYFKVLDDEKKNIKFNFEGGQTIEDQIDIWSNSGTVYIDNPKIKDSKAVLNIEIPQLGTMVLDISIEYEKVWIWSIPKSNFICIEPMMRGLNGLIDDPYNIKSNEGYSATLNIKLK